MQQLCYEVDVEPYARTRDAAINQLAATAGVEVSAHVSHTLYVGGGGWLLCSTASPQGCRLRGAALSSLQFPEELSDVQDTHMLPAQPCSLARACW